MNTRANAEWERQFEAYLKRRFPNRSTAKHYVSDVRIFGRHHGGPYVEVTTYDVDTFVDQQRTEGLAPATVKRRVASLKTFFDFVAEELAETERSNPVVMRRHAGRQPRHLPRDLSDEEVQCLLQVVDRPRDLAMISLMLYAGLRVGEVVDLRAMDITVPAEPQAPIRLRVMGKGRKERVAYLYRESYQPVRQYLERHPVQERQARVFRNRLGDPITVAGVQERVRHYAERSGVAVTCHRLRHTYGRWMAENEMPVLTLSRLLGHASVQSTQVYIDSADPQVRRSYEAAMEQSCLGSGQAGSAEPSVPIIERAGPATVVREVSPAFHRDSWMPEWPAWLRESCLGWVKHKWYVWKPSQRRRHADSYLDALRVFWRWQLAQCSFQGWSELTAAHMAAFADAQLHKGLNPKTVKTYLDRVYEMLRYLHQRGHVTSIPHRPEIALPDPLPRHLTPSQVVTLEDYIRQVRPQASTEQWLEIALYYLLSHVGLRIREALDLQVQDLDLAARRIHVREGKGRKDRIALLTPTAADAIARYLETVPHSRQDTLLSCRGQPLSYGQAKRRLKRLAKCAGIPELSAQRLRHTFATQLLNNGMSLEGLRRLMGHDKLDTTLIYARLADATLETQYRTAMERITSNESNSV